MLSESIERESIEREYRDRVCVANASPVTLPSLHSLAEQLHGAEAKHLKGKALPPRPQKRPRDTFATETRAPPRKQARTTRQTLAGGDEALHPSWAARREQKSPAIVPGHGSRVVFDDAGRPASQRPRRQAPASAETEALHPSWAAKVRAKAQASAAPQGQKIVFEDED